LQKKDGAASNTKGSPHYGEPREHRFRSHGVADVSAAAAPAERPVIIGQSERAIHQNEKKGAA
jgi:hypothetical protein